MADVATVVVPGKRPNRAQGQIDNRTISVVFGVGSTTQTYDEKFDIKIKVKKDILGSSNSAVVNIMNMNPQDRAFLVGEFNAWRSRKFAAPFVPIDIKIGRQSSGAVNRIFLGCLAKTDPSLPPDINVAMHCITSLNSQVTLAAADMPKTGNLLALCQWCAQQLKLTLDYQATQQHPLVTPQKLFSVSALPGMLNLMYADKLAIYIEDDRLVVRDIDKALKGKITDVNVNTGMIGIPVLNEWGLEFVVIADVIIPLSGGVKIASSQNPAVNGSYVVYAYEAELESRGNSWYITYRASPVAG